MDHCRRRPSYGIEDLTGMMGIEFLLIDEKCDLAEFRKEIRLNEVYYHIAGGIF